MSGGVYYADTELINKIELLTGKITDKSIIVRKTSCINDCSWAAKLTVFVCLTQIGNVELGQEAFKLNN